MNEGMKENCCFDRLHARRNSDGGFSCRSNATSTRVLVLDFSIGYFPHGGYLLHEGLRYARQIGRGDFSGD